MLLCYFLSIHELSIMYYNKPLDFTPLYEYFILNFSSTLLLIWSDSGIKQNV